MRELLDDHRGKVSNSLTRYLDPATGTIIEKMAARHALTTKSALAGRPYEDIVEERMIVLARSLGDQVTRCGDTLGVIRKKNGDIVITVAAEVVNGRTDVRIVAEAKRRGDGAQGFTANNIKDSLGLSRRNPVAEAGLFVTESAAQLPLGIGFHEFGGSNIAVTYDPTGDDTALAVAYRLLRFALMQEVRGAAGDKVDRDATVDVWPQATIPTAMRMNWAAMPTCICLLRSPR